MSQAIAYISRDTDGLHWKKVLEDALGPIDYRTLDNLGNTDDIEIALAWKPDRGLLASFKNIKLIVSLGMGVDHLLADDKLPDVPIVRIMDDGLVGQMSEYAIFWALRHHRDIDKYAASQRAEAVEAARLRRHHPSPRRRHGAGHDRPGHGREVRGPWLSRRRAGAARPRRCANIETFHGKDGFEKFLARTDILVDVLPLTRDTHGILDAAAFARLPKGAYFINMARGGHVVDEALLAALDSGHLAGAALDVFNTEPLPTDHRYWTHPKVQVTPHIAGATNPRTASPGIIENIKRLRSGRALINTVDPKTGY